MESIGDALNRFLKQSKWKAKVDEIKIQDEWEKIVGKTIAKYTHQVTLRDGILVIYTNVAPLKHELKLAELALIDTINNHFGENVIKKIMVK